MLFEHTKPRKGCIWLVFAGLLSAIAAFYELAQALA